MVVHQTTSENHSGGCASHGQRGTSWHGMCCSLTPPFLCSPSVQKRIEAQDLISFASRGSVRAPMGGRHLWGGWHCTGSCRSRQPRVCKVSTRPCASEPLRGGCNCFPSIPHRPGSSASPHLPLHPEQFYV